MKNIGRTKVLQYNYQNEFDSLCVCPHCGRDVFYGDMMKVNGINCCPACNKELHLTIEADQKEDYEKYVRKANSYEYEPYRYIEQEEETN